MKRNARLTSTTSRVMLLATAIALCGILTHADALTIDSSILSITGGWWDSPPPPGQYTSGTFDETGTAGEWLTLAHSDGMNLATCFLDSFDLHLSARSRGWTYALSPLDSGWMSMTATSTTLFHAETTQLTIGVNEDYQSDDNEGSLQVTLTDVTAHATLLNLNGWPNYHTYVLNTDPSHQYELVISGATGGLWDGWDARMDVQLQIWDCAPDGGVTLLLLAGALFALVGVKHAGFRPTSQAFRP